MNYDRCSTLVFVIILKSIIDFSFHKRKKLLENQLRFYFPVKKQKESGKSSSDLDSIEVKLL